MMFPEFFAQVPPLLLRDPLAELLGAAQDGLMEYRYSDAVKLAGHSCPTVAGAWLLSRRALMRLHAQGVPERGNLRVELRESQETGTTGVIGGVIALITGAAGPGGFKGLAGRHARCGLMTYGSGIRGEVRITRLDTDETVELSYQPGAVPGSPLLQTLLPQILGGESSPQERAEFGRLWQERVRSLLLEHADDPELIKEF
jgi:hypothetical protein